MPKYEAPSTPPENPKEFQIWMQDELRHLADALSELETDTVLFKQWNETVGKVYDGLVAYADGTNFDPQDGVGLYIYLASFWAKLLALNTDKQLVLPTGGTAALPTFAFGSGKTGIRESAPAVLRITINGFDQGLIDTNWIIRDLTVGGCGLRNVTASDTVATLVPFRGDTNTGIGHHSDDNGSLVAGGLEAIRWEDPADLGAAETSLWLYDDDNGIMEQVTVGAADSGGSGFKVLRIVN